jgi:hypothetical protein
MTNEELDEARAKEAWRIYYAGGDSQGPAMAQTAARLAREGWTPPEPVDPDVLALKEWVKGPFLLLPTLKEAYLAGARMAREQEQERAKVLVQFISGRGANAFPAGASETLAAYKAGRTAR